MKPTLGTAFNTNVGHTPYLEQWNVTVQREVMRNTILPLFPYVGSHGVHLICNMLDENPPLRRSVDPGREGGIFTSEFAARKKFYCFQSAGQPNISAFSMLSRPSGLLAI